MRQHIFLSAYCRTGLVKSRNLEASSFLQFKSQFVYSKPVSAFPNLMVSKSRLLHATTSKPLVVSSSPGRVLLISNQQYSSDAQSGQKKGGSKLKILLIGFGLGASVGLGYTYRKLNQKVMPIANEGSGNDLLYSEAPPVKLITKKVIKLRQNNNFISLNSNKFGIGCESK